jgi:hypothetical protein
MILPKDSLRIFLTFLSELDKVEVLAPVSGRESNLAIMGIVESKAQLLKLLDTVGIDHYIICSGDPFTQGFRVTAYEHSPKQIVDDLEKGYRRADELQLKILNGGKLTEDEQSFSMPFGVHLCSNTVKMDEGVRRIKDWFEAQKSHRTAKLGG